MHGSSIWQNLFRKKTFDGTSHLQSELRRCLSVFDVMSIAIGQMLGAGIYVLTGSVVRNQAGPSIIFSFLLAGTAALLSAFSYAEFGARYPRAGSAYTYAYVGIGEVFAFIIGWTILLEYMIGNAAVARSWSAYFDTLIDNRIANITKEYIGEMSDGGGFFTRQLDILAFILIVLVSIAVAMGSKASANLNTSLVLLNLSVLTFVIVYGLSFADFSNWFGSSPIGTSKFFPFGISGTLAGSATCFFSYIGFEALATAGEEAKNPQRTIPLATFGSLFIITIVYILMASSLTLMLPLDQIDPTTAFSTAFNIHGATLAKWVMTIGALIGMLNNLVTGAFALPRSVYAMADDGLIFSFFAIINKITKVPLNAIIAATLLNAIIAMFFDLEALVEFLSIGTLLAYSMVSACVLILRYQPAPIGDSIHRIDNGGNIRSWIPMRNFWESLPTGISISIAVIMLIISYFWLAINLRFDAFSSLIGCISLALSCISSIISFIFILGHEQNSLVLSFKVPLVPYIPCIGLLANCLMMVFLSPMTWIRLFSWLTIGLSIYFLYGIRHSKEGKKSRISAAETSVVSYTKQQVFSS